MRMYAVLAVGWFSFRLFKKSGLRLFQASIVCGFLLAGVAVAVRHFYQFDLPAGAAFLRLFFMFLSGAAFYVLKEHVVLSRPFFWLFVIALLSSAITDKHAFFVLYLLTIPYILFYVAYKGSGRVRKFNKVGDYSYGLYIYAFPVQQSVAALIPGVSVLSMILISAPVTLLLATLSCHLLERHALGLKGIYADHTRRMLSRNPTLVRLANFP